VLEIAPLVLSAIPALGPEWLNPESMLTALGDIAFWVVLGIIFAECGLLIGFFLPGDSLLFVTGLFIASGFITINIWVACLLLFIAAVVVVGTSCQGSTDPILNVGDLGSVLGKEIKTVGNLGRVPKTFYTFRNIPYAKRLTRELRFTV